TAGSRRLRLVLGRGVVGLLPLVGLGLVVRLLGEVEFGWGVLRPPAIGQGDQQAGGQQQADGSAALPAARGQVEHGSELPGGRWWGGRSYECGVDLSGRASIISS